MESIAVAGTKAPKKQNYILQGLLDWIERTGNRLPDPLVLFVILSGLVLLASTVFSLLGTSVTHPADGKVITAQNLLNAEGIRRILTEMVKNFAAFPPLGMVLVTMIGIGVAERAGLITAALKNLVAVVPRPLLPATLVFGGVMSNLAADAGYVVLVPLGAVLFAGFGRHPLAGMAAAFAGVSGGFSANLMLSSLDPLLAGITTKGAQILDPNYTVNASANYYFMFASTFLIVALGTFVTTRIVEPRLGRWTPPEGSGLDQKLGSVTAGEKRGLRFTAVAIVLFTLAVLAMVLPEGGALRDAKDGLKPFYESLVALLMLGFLLAGIAYGLGAKTIRSSREVAQMSSDTMGTMGAYIVLAFVAAQFVAYFGWSNLGVIFAISGADGLKAAGVTGIPLIIGLMMVTAFLNLFIGSASAKWAIMGPVFVPMLMMMGYSPELVQAAYRVGDSTTNIITPLLPYFPIIVAFARKYEPKTGIGNLISIMLPYSFTFFIGWAIFLTIWLGFGIPLGPEAPLSYVPARQ